MNLMNLVGPRDARLLRSRPRVVLPASFPQLVHDYHVFVGDVVAMVVRVLSRPSRPFAALLRSPVTMFHPIRPRYGCPASTFGAQGYSGSNESVQVTPIQMLGHLRHRRDRRRAGKSSTVIWMAWLMAISHVAASTS